MNARWRTGHNQHQKNDSCRPKMADSVGAESPYIHRQKTLDLWNMNIQSYPKILSTFGCPPVNQHMEDPLFVGHFGMGNGNAWISANGEFSV